MLFLALANLVAYSAGSLASGLAGCLALAAATGVPGQLQGRLINSLNVFHKEKPPSSNKKIYLYFTLFAIYMQAPVPELPALK